MTAYHLLLFIVFLPIVWTQGPRISLETANYFVSEADGSVTVCAVVNGGSLLSNVVVTITTLSSTATSPDDYVSTDEQHTFTPGGTNTLCSDIQINSDDTVESRETFSAGLQSAEDILESPTSAFILITDSSTLTLGFNQMEYFVSEGLALQVCVVVLNGEAERPVAFVITPGGGSASTFSDYLDAETTGSFQSGSGPGTERCQTVITFSDRDVENTETFLIQLGSLDAVTVPDDTAVVNIVDNDGVEVELQVTEVIVDEGNNGAVMQTQLCISLEDRGRGLHREANFILTSTNDNADNSDYVPLSQVIIGFSPNALVGNTACQTVTIIGDNIMEDDETFTVSIVPDNTNDNIRGSTTVTITIRDETDTLIACPQLSDPPNGDVIVSGVTMGSTATYLCDNGYNLVGSRTRNCGSNGAWTEEAPSCQIVDCDDPPAPSNAHPASAITSTTFGATVTYVCDVGYQSAGTANIECEANGSWSASGLQCNAVECGPLNDPTNGDVDVSQTQFPGVATYTCNAGYILSGGGTRTCQANQMWSGVAPTCRVVVCPPLPSPPNADVQHPSGFEYQSNAVYTCDTGYERSSGNLERTCSADGTWSGSEPVCDPVDCGTLSPPQNGDVLVTGTTFNNLAEYSCSNGYSITGSPTRLCMANGAWSGSTPSCDISNCGFLANPSNGEVQFNSTTFGSVARYVCTAGCEPVGDNTRTCTALGTWSGSSPLCPDISCGGLSNPANGIVQFSSSSRAGGMVIYVCNSGYEVVGDSERECLCSTEWSGSDPICQAIDCGDLEQPANGMVVTTPNTLFQSVATYECNEGYQLTGSMTRTCEGSGEWSGNAGQCEIVTCPILPDIDNGDVEAPDRVFNSVGTYTCTVGYRLNGDMERTCLSTGSWSGNEPHCSIITCELLDSPDNGALLFSNSIFLDSVAAFDCDAGFNLIGTDRRTCQENGEWTGQSPQCIEIVCGALSSPANGNVMVSGSGLGAVATYTCDPGYNMMGGNTRICLNANNPQWFSVAPTCVIVSCPDLANPENGMVQFSSGTVFQSIAEYSCDIGYQVTGPSSLTCGDDEEWSDSPPHCEIVVCPELSVPENGNIEYSAQTLVFNSSAEYMCGSGYMLNGGSERLCQSDGTWSSSQPLCRPVDCGMLSNPMNGKVQLARTTFEAVAVYECDENYNFVGSQTVRICQADSSWSGFPPTCQLIDCEMPPFVFNAFSPSVDSTTVGNTISYTCFSGYQLEGGAERTCQQNGEWSGETPRCVAIVCGSLNDPLNGQVAVNSMAFGSVAVYECDEGYALEGDSVRECAGEGTWSGIAPLCRIVMCPSLTSPDNGQVNLQSLEYQSSASYACTAGYLLIGDSSRTCMSSGSWSGEAPSCQPVDCQPLSAPANGQVNTPSTLLDSQATYTCLGSGYILTGDSSRQCGTDGMWTGSQPECTNIDECQNSNGMCQQICLDTEGSYLCTCVMGYVEMEGNPLLCQDENECEDSNGGCAHRCNNYDGGFNCSCNDKYTLSRNGKDCLDMNECLLGLDNCHPNATCSNTDGGFECFCNIGFEGDGLSCNNTDECVQSGSPCHEDAECTDTDGGFECRCRPGFTEDGDTNCLNVNECVTGNDCHPNATCTDTQGSYTCTCNDGNAGDGFICEAQCITNFQLVLGPVDSCLKWRFDSTSAKLTDITVATVLYLNTMCGCSLPPSHVSQTEFACADNEAQKVIYRAKLQGAEARDCSNLTRHLRDWIDDRSSILTQGNRLQLDPSCDLEVESLDIQAACVIGETPPSPTTSTTDSATTSTTDSGLSLEIIIGAAAAGALIVILFLLLVLVVCCICCRRSKDKRYEEDYSTLSRPPSQGRPNLTTSTSHSYIGSLPSVIPSGGRGLFEYNSNTLDLKSSSTFQPMHMSRAPSLPLMFMTDVRRHSRNESTRSGSFSSIDPNEFEYANFRLDAANGPKNFDDPVYEHVKGENDYAENPLYDTTT